MKSTLRIVCIALLAIAAAPALALQLGQIHVKSGLDQPLVAAIPLHPKNLAELKGLTVGLAPGKDFKSVGLPLTATDRTLRFHVTTNNNGQELILVTSSQPITDPYLDFLIEVNTRRGRQVREFVALLNPVISASAPSIQSTPVTARGAGTAHSAELPAPSGFPQPKVQSAPSAHTANEAVHSRPQPQFAPGGQSGPIHVKYGDTLYRISSNLVRGSQVTINQMMLALKAANPNAFFKDNIDDLKAGAILRMPTRGQVNQRTVAQAKAEVRRQYQEWRAAKPQPATLLTGSAERMAAKTAPNPAKARPTSAHLTLVPPTGKGGGSSEHPGVAGGTGSEIVQGLHGRLHDDRGSLISISQSNADLESRVKSLKDIAAKGKKLLSLKDATVAELQRKLAAVEAGGVGAAAGSTSRVAAGSRVARLPSTHSAAAAHVAVAATVTATRPAAQRHAPAWYDRPATWIIGVLIVVALVLIGVFWGKHRVGTRPRGSLPDPEDVSSAEDEMPVAAAASEEVLDARLARHPDDLDAHLQLCRLYYTGGDKNKFVEAADAMYAEVTDLDCVAWGKVMVMGGEMVPNHRLFARQHRVAEDARYRMEALWGTGDAETPVDAGETEVSVQNSPLDAGLDMAYSYALAEESQDSLSPTGPRVGVLPAVGTQRREPSGAEFQGTAADLETGNAAPSANGLPDPSAIDPASGADASASESESADTTLDLARAYLDTGDPLGARAVLEEVLGSGSPAQKDEAKRLLAEAGVTD